jgi:hypothetical protein
MHGRRRREVRNERCVCQLRRRFVHVATNKHIPMSRCACTRFICMGVRRCGCLDSRASWLA